MTVGGQAYTSTTIHRTMYSLDTIDKKNNITITFPGDNTFALAQLHATAKVNVVIATLTGNVFYRGLSISVSYSDNKIMMKFEPLVRFGLNVLRERRMFQPNCPYKLYGDNCQVTPVVINLLLASVVDDKRLRIRYDTANPSNSSFDVLPVQVGLARANIGRLLGGYLEHTPVGGTAVRFWIDDLADASLTGQYVFVTVTLLRHHNLTAPLAMTGAVGCRRNTDDCANLHNNIRRYGGFPALRPAPGQGTTG